MNSKTGTCQGSFCKNGFHQLRSEYEKIFAVNNDSGHYRPNRQSLKLVKRILNRLYKTNKELFDEDSKWRKNDQ